MKIIVISLPDSPRRKFIERQFRSLKIEFDFFDAINGKSLSASEMSLCDTNAIQNNPRWLNPGAIGCALSHYFVYRKMLDDNIDRAIVMEDDMIITKNSLATIDALSKRDLKEEIILLYYRSGKRISLSIPDHEDVGGVKLLAPYSIQDIPTAAGCYYITRQSCEKLANFILPIRVTADSWGYFVERANLRGFLVAYPRIVEYAGFKSEIGYHDMYSGKLMKLMKRVFDRIDFFPVNLILRARRKAIEDRMSNFDLTDMPSVLYDSLAQRTAPDDH